MPISDFDRELEKLSAPEARQQRLVREEAERKRHTTGPPGLTMAAGKTGSSGSPPPLEAESPAHGGVYDAAARSRPLKTASARIKSPIPVSTSAIPTTMPNSEICDAM
jgi:hypothetical protein